MTGDTQDREKRAIDPQYSIEVTMPPETLSFRAVAIYRVEVPEGILWLTASGDDAVDDAGLPLTPTAAPANDLDGAMRLARLFLKSGRRRD